MIYINDYDDGDDDDDDDNDGDGDDDELSSDVDQTHEVGTN